MEGEVLGVPSRDGASLEGSQPPPATRELGPYRIEGELGRGSQGRVVAALDRRTGERVALKILESATPAARSRLKDEFQALRRFRHAHLARVRELSFVDAAPVLAMELVEGSDVDVWWRSQEGAGPEPLARLALQLVDALEHLHAAGFVHRDVKAANVRVEPSGRAVLLDLGDVTRAGAQAVERRDDVAGTVSTMAPEVAWRGPVSAATDVYSLASLLFELIEGHPPFRGAPGEVLVAKARRAPAAPGRAPARLGALLSRAMAPDPEARPDMEELRRGLVEVALGEARTERARSSSAAVAARAGELAELERLALAAFAAREPALLVLEGEPGIGKTTLAELLATRLGAERGATVLCSRCAPTLRVELPGLDGIVEGLARLGDAAPPPGAEAATRAAVARTFPALAGSLGGRGGEGADVEQARSRATALVGVATILAHLAQRRRLVLFVDDLQWCDEESLGVFTELLAMRAPLVFIATTRPGAESAGARRLLEASGDLRSAHRLLPRLALEETVRIVRAAATTPLDDSQCRVLAERSRGHPLFAWELARATDPAGATLDALLGARRAALGDAARALLDVVAWSEDALPLSALAHAAGVGRGVDAARALVDDGWLRETPLSDAALLEPYHDLVRQAVRRETAPERRATLEARLADAIEAGDLERPLALARHRLAAGDAVAASDVALREAKRAEDRGAYDLASELLAVAVDTARTPTRRAELLEWRGRMLATCGRPGRAADAFLAARAIWVARGERERLASHLAWRAGAWLMRSGRIEEGAALLSEQADREGLPEAPDGALGFARAVLAQRRTARDEARLRARVARLDALEPAPEDVRDRADALWAFTHAMAHASPPRAVQRTLQHLAVCAEAGDAPLVARALGPCAVAWGRDGDPDEQERARRTAALACEVASRIGDPAARALAVMASASARFYLGEFAEGLREVDACRAVLAEGGASSDITLGDCFGMGTMLGWLGCGLEELDSRRHLAIAHGRSSGDGLVLAYCQTGLSILPALARGDAARAVRDLDAALGPYTAAPGAQPHTHAAIARALAALYEGDASGALDHLGRELRTPARTGLVLLVRTNRSLFALLTINALLRRAGEARGARAAAARAGARHLAARLSRDPCPLPQALGTIARAAVAEAEGRLDEGARLHRSALAEAAPWPMLSEALRHRLHVRGEAVTPAAWPRWIAAPTRLVDALLPGRSAP